MEKYISAEVLKSFMLKAFLKVGVPLEDASIVVDVLIESDLRGIDSHGVNRFKPFYIDRILNHIQEPITKMEIIKDTPTTAVIDGHNGMGMVIASQAMKMAITKAKYLGLGMVVVRNSTHYGIAGYYATMASNSGLIGITGTNARPSIAPTFGVQNKLGTNPLTWAIPTDEAFPFIFDAATSTIQRGRVEYYARNNQPTPEGMIIGEDGKTRTDSAQILIDLVKGKAAFAPLGGIGDTYAGYKGYNFATIVEILSSALQQGSFLNMLTGVNPDGSAKPIPVGHFFIAINPEFFMGLESFKKTTGDILRELRASKKADPNARIFTAGEKEHEAYLKRSVEGIPLSDSLLNELKTVNEQLGLNYTFTFIK